MIARRPQVEWVASTIIAIGFAVVLLPILTADRWIATLGGAHVVAGEVAPLTVRVPPLAGIETPDAGRIGGGGGVVIARGDLATRDDEFKVAELTAIAPSNTATYIAMFLFAAVLAGLFSLRARRSPLGRLVRVQVVNLTLIAVLAAIVKAAMLATPANVLIVPVAVLALLPTLVLDRVVGLAVGALAALVVALCVPFDLGIAILLVVQATAAGFAIGERPRKRATALLAAGGVATALMAVGYPALQLLISGHLPLAELRDPMRSAWLAATVGPLIAMALAVLLAPLYQVLVGEITQGKLIELEDLSQPLLKQIAEKAPGSWQASLMMANLGEIAANAIGANGRLVRVGAYYHDLGKSLQPKYFIENLEPGATSPHDKLPADASCDAIFAHVTEGIVAARKAGLHERIVDFIQSHHSGGVLEHFWDKCREQGNPKGLTVEYFRYPGALPQTRETAILAICDAVEAASRTVRPNAIDTLVRRIVYGKLDRGQLAESGLSIAELRTICDSLGETLRHANHGRAENVAWQKSEQSASATPADSAITAPRLDSLDRPAKNKPIRAMREASVDEALEDTEEVSATPKLRRAADSGGQPPIHNELATSATAPIPLLEKRASVRESDRDIAVTDRVAARGSEREVAMAITEAAERARATAERATRDSRREADRAAMAARYASDPATRDSDPGTKEFERDEPEVVAPPAAFSSRDGSRRVQHSKPSDGDEAAGEARGRANKRTNDTDPRNRATGDFVANMVLQPLVKDAIPTSLSDVDTGRHAKQAAKDSSKEIELFASEAGRALRAAAPDLDVLPPSPRALSESDTRNDDAPAARKRAATLPPVPGLSRPPTVQPPQRRAPTVPPPAQRPPTIEPVDRNVSRTLFGGAAELRPPAKREQTGPQPSLKVETATNPAVRGIDIDASRDDAARARDDAATTQPSMAALDAKHVAEVDAFNRHRADVAITKPPFAAPQPASGDDSATTQPAMPRAIAEDQLDSSNNSDVGDDTQPTIDLPLPAPAFSDPVIQLDRLAAPPPPAESASARQNTWARGLAARIDASLDDEFGRDTPTRAPSRAELQALVDTPPDATRQQSVEEIERLARDPAARRSQEELQFTAPRRAFPTAEVREEDIEAAIEIVPSARRTGSIPIGIAKKKPSE